MFYKLLYMVILLYPCNHDSLADFLKYVFPFTVRLQSTVQSGCFAIFGGVHNIDCSPTVIKETAEYGRSTSGTE